MSCVYLLHFDRPFHNALHYVGWTNKDNPYDRLFDHQRGVGGKYTAKVVKAGIKLRLACYWFNANEGFERLLKDRISTKSQCPHCGGTPLDITDPDYLTVGITCERIIP